MPINCLDIHYCTRCNLPLLYQSKRVDIVITTIIPHTDNKIQIHLAWIHTISLKNLLKFYFLYQKSRWTGFWVYFFYTSANALAIHFPSACPWQLVIALLIDFRIMDPLIIKALHSSFPYDVCILSIARPWAAKFLCQGS